MIAAPTGITPFQSASLYVGDLNPDVTESVLFELFNRVGPVASIRVCRDSVTRRSLGYAYVNFHNVQDAERALDTMNFTDIQAKPCRIMWSQRDPSLRKTGLGNVFVRNLAPSVDNKGLYDTFSVFGNILSCKVATDETGKSKGYGYVHFESAESATDAIQKFDGMLIDDMEVHVGHFVRRQDRVSPDTWTNLYVKQFPTSWDDDKLRKVFEPHGVIQSLFIQKDETGKSRGFGFINFETHEAAAKAVEALHNKPFPNPFYEAPAEGAAVEESDKPELVLYVGKAQKKADRVRELKTKQDSMNLERITKFQGMNLYVKNIADSVSDDIFRDTFTVFGPVTSARIMREANEARTSKGFGFVCFQSADDAAKAVAEMNGKNLGGKPLYVTFYQKKDVRRAQFAANYAPGQMHHRGGGGPGFGSPGGPMPFMGMYMPQQQQGGYGGPRGGPGGFNNQFGGPRGPMQPRGPGGNMPPNMMPQQPGRGYFPGNMPPQPGQAPYMQQQGMPRPRGPPNQMPPQQFPPLQQGFPGPRGMPQPGPGPRGMPNMPPNMQPRGPMPPNMQPGMPPTMQGLPRGMYPPNMPPNMMPPNMQQPQQPFPGMPGRGPMPPNMGPGGPNPAQVKFTNQARNMNPGMMGGPGGMMPPQPMPGQMGAPNMPPQKMDFSEALLATADPMQQKNMIGERLYPLIFVRQPEQAGKITGMLLEMDNGELLNLIESPEALHSKIDEALTVLRNHNQG